MRFIKVEPGEDLQTLAKRLYQPTTKAAQREAEDALLRANPQLSRRQKSVPDAVIAAPEVRGKTPQGETVGEPTPAAVLLEEVRTRIAVAEPLVRERLDLHEQRLKADLEVLNAPEVRKITREDPEAAERVAELKKTMRAELEQNTELAALHAEALKRMAGDVAELLGRFGAGAQPTDAPPPG